MASSDIDWHYYRSRWFGFRLGKEWVKEQAPEAIDELARRSNFDLRWGPKLAYRFFPKEKLKVLDEYEATHEPLNMRGFFQGWYWAIAELWRRKEAERSELNLRRLNRMIRLRKRKKKK